MMGQRAGALLETTVAAAVIGAMVLGVSQFYGSSQKSKRKVRIRAVQEALARDIANRVRTPSAIYLSILDEDNNTPLIKCLVGALDGCTAQLTRYDDDRRNDFALLYPTQKEAFEQISSGSERPLFYDIRGAKCEEPGGNCVFEAQTFFYATCPDGEATCKEGASHLHVAYQVRQLEGTMSQLGAPLPPIPKKIRFYSLSADEIFGPSINSDCNLGAVITGYDERGRAICKCTQPYVTRSEPPIGNRRGPLCRRTIAAELVCPDDMVFRGMKSDGTPDCKTMDEAYECVSVRGNRAQDAGTCLEQDHSQYWITMTEKSQCNFHCTVNKGGGRCYSEEGAGDDRQDRQKRQLGDAWVLEGMICKQRMIRCCRPK